MSDESSTEQAFGEALSDGELTQMVGGAEGPPGTIGDSNG